MNHASANLSYEVIKAKSYEEAVKNSSFFVGQRAEVTGITASGNSDGTYTVMPEFKTLETRQSRAAANAVSVAPPAAPPLAKPCVAQT